MKARIDDRQFSPGALQAMLALEKHLAGCGLDHKFMHAWNRIAVSLRAVPGHYKAKSAVA
jgi:hypothetical protein